MLAAVAIAALLAQGPAAGGAADPAFAPDGRLAVSIRGDLWLVTGDVATPAAARWTRLTAGPATDLEPAWTPDGSALVFASDRAGGFDLWRLELDAEGTGPAGEPERLTRDPAGEREPANERDPTVLADGGVVFEREMHGATDLWLRAADGEERRLTDDAGDELDPAATPAGDAVAYAARGTERASLRVLDVASGADSALVEGVAAEHPAWSPDGARLAFATRDGTPGTWVTDRRGAYVNLLDPRPAAAAWTPDGDVLVLATLPPDEPGYNGDPARVDGRGVTDGALAAAAFPATGELLVVPSPAAPGEAATTAAVPPPPDRAAHNLAVFDAVHARVRDLYYSDAAARAAGLASPPAGAADTWARLADAYRADAAAAPDDAALRHVLHRLISERPHLREPATGRAVVSSAHPVATAAGLEMLRRGGTVVDAAVAVSFALGVVEPDASGIGGYGQMLVHRPGMERPWLVEFMTRAPQDAGLDNAALLEDGELPEDGPVLANVPGTAAGMRAAWERFGSLPWAALLEPAIRAAADGYPVSDGLATTLRRERAHFLKYPGSRALFYRDCAAEPPEDGDPPGTCVPYAAGETLRNPDLADVLRRIAEHGPDALYGGDVGRRMVADLRARGSALRLRDLERYFAAERDPVCGEYRGDLVCSSAPPVAGGAGLVAKLNLLEHVSDPVLYTEDAATLHAMIEAWRLQPSSRGRIADPGLWPVDVDAVTSPDTAAARWRCFDPGRALGEEELEEPLACAATSAADDGTDDESRSRRSDSDTGHRHGSGTTSFVVASADGAIVSVTQTLGTWGGNFYVTPGLGFLYNDKLGSYADDPDDYGARLPNARHGSTISPTIGYRGTGSSKRPWFGIGAAGNAWITAAVYEMAVGIMDFGLGPQAALELPRFLPSSRSTAGGEREPVVLIESGVSPDVLRALETLGHELQTISLPGELRMGYGAAAVIEDGRATAGADPRRSGAAGGLEASGWGLEAGFRHPARQ